MSPVSRAWHLCLTSYIIASVLYTTTFLVANLVGSPLKNLSGISSSSGLPLRLAKETWELSATAGSRLASGNEHYSVELDDQLLSRIDSGSRGLNLWQGLNGKVRLPNSDSRRILSLDEELVFSKAFATSMRPSKVIPYYYKASGPFSQDEVTITSIITSDRLDVFARLVEKYKGAIHCHEYLTEPR